MSKIEISQEILNWLKDNMASTDYSVEQVIERLIERYKKEEVAKPPGISEKVDPAPVSGQYERVYRPQLRNGRLNSFLPDLTYAKIASAQVNGRQVRPRWNIVREEVFGAVGSASALRALPCELTIHEGNMGSGYIYLPELDISLRRRDAVSACFEAVYAALIHGIGLDIRFFRQRSGKMERIVVGDY